MTRHVAAYRGDFPSLKQGAIYLDSAATSLTPEPVLRAMETYYREYRASTHRGLYASAQRTTEVYEQARTDVARFIGADAGETIFTSGATASSNMLTYMLEHSLSLVVGDEIVSTVMEHHASLIPLQELAMRKGLALKHVPLSGVYLDYDKVGELITERTKIVSVLLASNVLGTINDVARIAEKAHAGGALMVVDATAATGHIPIDVRALGCDFLYFSGHKMCGPTGVGVLYGKKERLEKLRPGNFGGGMVDTVTLTDATYTMSPHCFEPGTPNIAGVIGLGAAANFLADIGIDTIRQHCQELTAYAQAQLTSVTGQTCYSAPAECNVGIVSFTLEGVHPHDIAQVCADQGVAIRAGHHCAMPLHTAIGISATARASFYMYNTKEEVDALVHSVRKVATLFQA